MATFPCATRSTNSRVFRTPNRTTRKITVVGAGSHIFARRLVTDVLTWPSLQDSTITLIDVNDDKLELMAALARRMVAQALVGARVEATTDLKQALDGADDAAVAIRVGRFAPRENSKNGLLTTLTEI